MAAGRGKAGPGGGGGRLEAGRLGVTLVSLASAEANEPEEAPAAGAVSRLAWVSQTFPAALPRRCPAAATSSEPMIGNMSRSDGGRSCRRGPAMPADPRRSLGAMSARYRASPGCVLGRARDVPGAPERLDSGAQKSDELVRAVGRDSDEAGGRLEPHDGVAIGEEEAVRAERRVPEAAEGPEEALRGSHADAGQGARGAIGRADRAVRKHARARTAPHLDPGGGPALPPRALAAGDEQDHLEGQAEEQPPLVASRHGGE